MRFWSWTLFMLLIGGCCHKVFDKPITQDYAVMQSTETFNYSDNVADLTMEGPMKYTFSEGQSYGSFWFEDGTMHFKGDADKSAKQFFLVFKKQVDEYISKEKMKGIIIPYDMKFVDREMVKEVPKPLSKFQAYYLFICAIICVSLGFWVARYVYKV